MRNLTLPLLLAASLGAATPTAAQDNFGDILSGVAKSLLTQELDKNAYVQAQNLNTATGYRNYLAQYPKGIYRANAERALAKLGAPVTPNNPPAPASGTVSAAAVEGSIGLTRTRRMTLQTQLSALGYPTGVADGLWGSNTRGAIVRWQTANKVSATGYLTAQQVNLIEQQARPVVGSDPVGSVTVDDRTEERLLSLTADERREIQRRLTRLGYRTGGVDGVFGGNTRRALASWQRDEGLRASGYMTADQLRELRRQTG